MTDPQMWRYLEDRLWQHGETRVAGAMSIARHFVTDTPYYGRALTYDDVARRQAARPGSVPQPTALEVIETHAESAGACVRAILELLIGAINTRRPDRMSTDQIARITKAGLDRMERDLAAEGPPALPPTPDPPGFELGDVVRLKSGGPEMTVTCLKPYGMLGCEWFSSVGALGILGHDFPAAALRRADAPASSAITNALGQP